MSKKKAGGTARQHVSPAGKRLGVKVADGESVTAGSILVRQRGSQIHPGQGADMGRDFSVFALQDGTVKYANRMGKKIVSVQTT